ncbi:hypothetical protein AAFC00_004831 [Neodothiora populina]|uniref:Translin n=1 Tax=Neodothiora populina TaxID=2781224 RepID=A0ABR3P4Q5_9PEZI
MANTQGMLQPQIFESLQQKIDEDTAVRDSLREIVQTLEKQGKATQAILSRAHSSSSAELSNVVSAAEESVTKHEVDSIQKLSKAASKYPYYKYNGMWTRQVQDASFSILFTGYLGGFNDATSTSSSSGSGKLLTIDQVGAIMGVPVNLKTTDSFHLTIEEYLQSLISLIDELSRLARNCVTQGDYTMPVAIASFIKNVHAGFQILNLKNDALRKRSDGVKYRVKEVEDVVYDLSLRGLVQK